MDSPILDSEFYNLTQELGGALFGAMRAAQSRAGQTAGPVGGPLLQIQRGYAESPGWFLIQATEFDPEPLTIAGLRVRDIYASERMVAALLDLMAAEQRNLWINDVDVVLSSTRML
jgi:hypothetical protein